MPGAVEPGREKILLVKSDKKNGDAVTDTKSETVVTESDPDENTSGPKPNENETNANFEIDSSMNSTAPRLKKALVAEKNPEDKNGSEPEDAKTPVSVKQAEIRNPTLTLNDFEDGSIFQRRGQSADIVVSGTWKYFSTPGTKRGYRRLRYLQRTS
jgi:hypothetical protein